MIVGALLFNNVYKFPRWQRKVSLCTNFFFERPSTTAGQRFFHAWLRMNWLSAFFLIKNPILYPKNSKIQRSLGIFESEYKAKVN